MADPRVKKLAEVLVHYSLALQAGDQFAIYTTPLAEELALAVYEEAVRAGAYISVHMELPGADEILYRHGSDAQLDQVDPLRRWVYTKTDAMLNISADYNTRHLSGVDPSRISRRRSANRSYFKESLQRMASGELRWCGTLYPTQALAQDADMSLSEYQDFVYGAGLLDAPDPVALWKEEAARQQRIIEWLAGRDQVRMQGGDIDLQLSIQGRTFDQAAGRMNFPDGEIYTSPVETSANGWVRFRYPAIYQGKEVTGVELWFEDGVIVKEQAEKGGEYLTALLNTDAGSRRLGEWGIGMNYNIQRFTKQILFDEKIGGTIHLAVGAGFPETGGQNESGVHWDMICDMSDAEVTVDGEVFYREGKVVV